MPLHGTVLHRGLRSEYVPRSTFADPGVFGRMFPTLRARPHELTPELEQKLEALAARMQERSDAAGGGEENPRIPAGFTFLGQFIDHDITFDPTSSLEQQNDPEAIRNYRTPLLELDSVYGSGRSVSSHLYDQPADSREAPVKFLIGIDSNGDPNDLPRNRQGTALIGDPRNDENLLISQLHLTFLKFHNRVVDYIRDHGVERGFGVPDDPDNIFYEAQRVVRWHYQWIVVHEFLRLIVGQNMVDDILYGRARGNGKGDGKRIAHQDPIGNILDRNFQLFRWKVEPSIPVEFAVAAYRFGHSQVRPVYFIQNGVQARMFPAVPGDADFVPLDQQSTLFVPLNLTDFAGQWRVLRADRQADMAVLFDLNGRDTARRSMRIDTMLSPSLFRLPTGPGQLMSLALRNLRRGYAFALPWGERVAEAIGVDPLTQEQLDLADLGFPWGRTPLWYYILKEAETLRGKEGQRLGPVGGRIVAEVLLGLLLGDAKSYLADQPNWTPFLPPNNGDFTMADLIRFAHNMPAMAANKAKQKDVAGTAP